MARYYGRIGFISTIEDPPGSGIWREVAIEKNYKGDLTRRSYRYIDNKAMTDDITMENQISVVADDFAMANLGYMKYAEVNGTMWEIVQAEINRPRITLSLGGVYNGKQA